MRHRQRKGAATDMFGLKPPAPHSDSTDAVEKVAMREVRLTYRAFEGLVFPRLLAAAPVANDVALEWAMRRWRKRLSIDNLAIMSVTPSN